jgi:hypothetical protein
VSWAQTLQMPPHEKVVLKNGLTVLLLEKHGVPLVNISAIVKTGAAADPAGQEGLASATAGLLRKGTKARSAQQFAADLDFIGGSFESGAEAEWLRAVQEDLPKFIPFLTKKCRLEFRGRILEIGAGGAWLSAELSKLPKVVEVITIGG